MDPIEISDGPYLKPHPVVEEGNHRLIAALVSKQKTIDAVYTGGENLLYYLIGKTSKF